MEKDDEKLTLLSIVGIVLVIVLGVCILLGIGIINNELKTKEETIQELTEEVDYYKNDCLRTGYIVYYSLDTILVYDEYEECLIELFIESEQETMIHCEIEVGDIALYMVGYQGQDAELLGIIKGGIR